MLAPQQSLELKPTRGKSLLMNHDIGLRKMFIQWVIKHIYLTMFRKFTFAFIWLVPNTDVNPN